MPFNFIGAGIYRFIIQLQFQLLARPSRQKNKGGIILAAHLAAHRRQ
jgi:hypothetical protein